jgi:hypothetical protein
MMQFRNHYTYTNKLRSANIFQFSNIDPWNCTIVEIEVVEVFST